MRKKGKRKNPFTKVSSKFGPPVLIGPCEKNKPHNGHSATNKAWPGLEIQEMLGEREAFDHYDAGNFHPIPLMLHNPMVWSQSDVLSSSTFSPGFMEDVFHGLWDQKKDKHWPTTLCIHQKGTFTTGWITIWLFNIAMENLHFIAR